MLHRRRKILWLGLILIIGLWVSNSRPVRSAVTGTSISEFPTSGQPGAITTGPDGNLWFTEPNAIGRITPSGVVTEFPLPSGSSQPKDIAAGPDGNVWFTLPFQNNVGRITPAGAITETEGFTMPWGITLGPDGHMWITESDLVAQITTTGTITAFPTDLESYPEAIAAGPDGDLWYVMTVFHRGGTEIGRTTPAGVYTMVGWGNGIFDLTVGRDGNIWFTQMWGNKIGRITPTGTVTEFVLPLVPDGSVLPGGITSGPDGYIWFTGFDTLGRITPSGQVNYFSAPGVGPGITTGPDGNIWFTEDWNQKIGRLRVYQLFLPVMAR